ncbi:fatty acid desaturase [Tenacibaculum jejuense]|uniref:Putative Ferredoxin--NAD(+) reductase n=1 Tax=Tenacibaculum jejuense TaxID=584609 RepID=A0A238U830_9FLAO|nr:fatty acid desaturase [Tenacibaculum jejuense]SNR14560.1 putative Ferredoxin--NAD(+) reductase [Tenacibaculum jejuense]
MNSKRKTQIAYPTVLLFLGLSVSYLLLYYLFDTRIINESLTVIIGAFLAYSMFTVVHEASHGNISRGNSKFIILEKCVGWISASFLFFPFSAFKIIHLKHHAHTNDSEEDPDGYVRGKNMLTIFFKCLTLIGHYYVVSLGVESKKNEAIRKTRNQTLIFISLIPIITIGVSTFNFWYEFIMVFLLPALVAAPILGFTFDWLPHYPHHNMDKYHNTRIVTIPGLEFLSFFQSYHLIHHLYPRVPFYLYKKKYQLVEQELRNEKSPIEGFGVNELKVLNSKNTYTDVLEGKTWRYSLEVAQVRKLTHDSAEIQFKNLGNIPYQFNAGQYVVISMLVDGEKVSRCYSICSNPNLRELKIGVKRVSGGKLSNRILDHVSEGKYVNVAGPFGTFKFKDEIDVEHHVFIAGGSGITPIISILQKILQDGITNVSLIYGCKSEKDIMFHKELIDLQNKYPNQFSLKLTYDLLTNAYQTELLSHFEKANYYICGPTPMMEASKEVLYKKGVTSDHIIIEEFSYQEAKPFGNSYKVSINNKHFSVYESETILEGAKRNKVAIPYACSMGQCGTCKCELKKGKVAWKTEEQSVLLENEKNEGFILTCMCKPKSDIKLNS